MNNEYVTLKVIIADTDLETFNGLKELNEKFNTIFLSSEFAVNFILGTKAGIPGFLNPG